MLQKNQKLLLLRASKQADAILLNIHLAELRKLVGKTQMDMAAALGVKQPTVAEMDKPGLMITH